MSGEAIVCSICVLLVWIGLALMWFLVRDIADMNAKALDNAKAFFAEYDRIIAEIKADAERALGRQA